MICPSCGYTYGFQWHEESSDYEQIRGDSGDFYSLPILLERESSNSYYNDKDTVGLIGCPSYSTTFINN